MEQKTKSVFETLNAIDCSEHTETKGKLTYLSWVWAWQILKKNYPTATYKIYEDANGRFYHTDGRTAWVKTGVTVEGIENIEYLPIMDCYKKSITVDKLTSFDVNTAIQRSLTKAVARHGLGLYIYAGEDLPEETAQQPAPQPEQPTKTMNIDRDMAFDDVRKAKSSQGVADVWNQHQWLHKDAEFVALVKEVGGKLKAENK